LVNGTGISLSGTNAAQLAEPGWYLVSYYLQGDPQGGNEVLRFSLSLNDAQVPGTLIANVTGATGGDPPEPGLSHTAIVQVTTPDALLQLTNGPLGLTHIEILTPATTTAS
jgi:hypothetical protein